MPAAPVKSSTKTWDQPAGGVGAAAFADGEATVAAAAARRQRADDGDDRPPERAATSAGYAGGFTHGGASRVRKEVRGCGGEHSVESRPESALREERALNVLSGTAVVKS